MLVFVEGFIESMWEATEGMVISKMLLTTGLVH